MPPRLARREEAAYDAPVSASCLNDAGASREGMANRADQIYRRLTGLAITLMVAGCLAGIAVPAGLGWDFANFYDAGRRAGAGQIEDVYDPLSLIAGQTPQGSMRFWGAPVSAFLYTPMSGLSAETALILFKIENVLAFFATFVVLFFFSLKFLPHDRVARWRFAAVFAFLCLLYQPFWTVFRVGGQTTPTVLLLLTLALVAHVSGRVRWSALGVVLATLLKPALAPMLVYLMCVSGLSFLGASVGILAVVGLASLAWLGWPIHATFPELMLNNVQTTFPWPSNSSLYILIDNLRLALGPTADTGVPRVILVVLRYALRGTVLATVVYLGVTSRAQLWPAEARRHWDFLLAILLFLLWSVTLWEHYLAMLFLPLIYVVAAHQHFSRRALGLVAAIFLLSLGQNLIFINFLREQFAFSSAPALVGIALFKSGPLLLTLVFLWGHAGEIFNSYTTPMWTSFQTSAHGNRSS